LGFRTPYYGRLDRTLKVASSVAETDCDSIESIDITILKNSEVLVAIRIEISDYQTAAANETRSRHRERSVSLSEIDLHLAPGRMRTGIHGNVRHVVAIKIRHGKRIGSGGRVHNCCTLPESAVTIAEVYRYPVVAVCHGQVQLSVKIEISGERLQATSKW